MRNKQMKKLLLTGIAATLVSTSALASQARLLALGMKETDNEGLYYIQDSRNIFQNPAWINAYANTVIVEYGDKGSLGSLGGNSAALLDGNTTPKAQGGILQKVGDYVFGVYLGNESNTSTLLRVVGTSAAAAANDVGAGAADKRPKLLQSADNQLDLYLGSEANGMKWGVNAVYAAGKDDTRKGKDSSAAIRGGVIADKWDAHLNVSLMSKAEAEETYNITAAGFNASVKHEFKGKLGLQVGGSYLATDSMRVFGYVKHFSWEQEDSADIPGAARPTTGGQKGTVKGDFNSYYVGTTHTYKVSESDTVYTTVHLKKTDVNLKFTNKGEVRHIVVPVTMAYEAKATDWLTLRGSIIQNLYGARDNKNLNSLNAVAKDVIKGVYGDNGKSTLANSTEVNAGMTFTFGNLAIDGLIGATNADRTGGLSASGTNTGTLTFDNLMSRVGMTYKF